MQACVVQDGNVRVVDRDDPEPGTGELLIRVHTAGINGADLWQLRGDYSPPAGVHPGLLGLEFAGEVVARGAGATRFELGDAVMGILSYGAQAELVVSHERLVVPVPADLGSDTAGAFPEVFTTAFDALFNQARLGLGERLLINGGAGGVGTAAVQLAIAAGAQVTASVRDPELRERVAVLGAEVVEPAIVVDAASSGIGNFDVILELVGGPHLASDVELLAMDGRLCVIGVGAGRTLQIDAGTLMRRRARIMGSTLRGRPLEAKALLARQIERHVLPLLGADKIRVPIDANFALADAVRAYEHFARGGKFGKVILRIGE